ncbi:tetratricopeptide repeat protein [Streptomyces sp. NPDC091682]|uniref:tetratricopeptide repeat protein n=1 Tax=Streptomyces sp. NPDC091682 TaxID=3366005 RepID=UPI003817860E
MAGDYVVHRTDTPAAPNALRALPQAPDVLSGREEAIGELLKTLAPGGSKATVVSGLAGAGKTALALTVAQQVMEEGCFEGGVLFVGLRGYLPNGALGGGQAVSLLLGELGIRDEDVPPTPEGRLALYRSELAARAAEGRRVLIVADDAGEIGQVRDLDPTGSGRWRMHDLVRLYAAELARPHAEEDGWDAAAERLICLYGALLVGSDGHLRGRTDEEWSAHVPDATTALQVLDEERDNLIALVPFTAALGKSADVNGFCAYLQTYLRRRRLFQEAVALNRLSLAEAERSGDAAARNGTLRNLAMAVAQVGEFEEAAALRERFAPPDPGETPHERAGRLLNEASLALISGRTDQAVAAAEESLRLFGDLGDRRSEGEAWSNLGIALQEQGRCEEAVAAQERANTILSEAGHPHSAAAARRNLGGALSAAGRHEAAITAYEQAVAMFAELAEVHEVGVAFAGLAEALDRAGRARAAVEAHGKAVRCFRHTGDQRGEAHALVMHGIALAGLRDFEGAALVHERACTLSEDIGDRSGAGYAQFCLASALSQSGRADEARAALLRSASAYAEAGDEARSRLATLMFEGIRSRPNRRRGRRAGRLLRRRGRPAAPEEP